MATYNLRIYQKLSPIFQRLVKHCCTLYMLKIYITIFDFVLICYLKLSVDGHHLAVNEDASYKLLDCGSHIR